MKTFFLIIAAILISLMTGQAQSDKDFYYAFDDKIYLNPVINKYAVEFVNNEDESVFDAYNLSYTKISQKLYEVEGDLTEIELAGQDIFTVNKLYTTNDGLAIYMKNSIILQWKEGTGQIMQQNLISQFGLIETKSTRLYTTYKVNNPLPISQTIYETGLVRYCHPVFFAEVEKQEHIPNDEYFGQQFYLHNTGQECNDGHFGTADADIDAPDAWGITFGSSEIIVAVIDDGATDNHPDLPSSRQLRLPGSNFAAPYDFVINQNVDDPSPVADWGEQHGNSCAGVIGAEINNDEGIAGLAPECTIMPVKVPMDINIYGSAPVEVFADAITFAVDNGATIISNSWAFRINEPNYVPAIVSAIEDAISKGVIVIFAAGNSANQIEEDQGFVYFPANANIPQLISVGASDRNDKQANYSPSSENIDISAPSHTAYNSGIEGEAFNIWTIDIPGNDGNNTWPFYWSGPLPPLNEELPSSGINHLSYTGRFGGTSASAPQVAGVVALMLSINPCLSVNQITDILYNTCDKVGDYDYYSNPNKFGHSMELGYGRLNAFLAVQAAKDMYVEGVDLYTKDVPEDFGVEPDVIAEFSWVSDDIWVRNQQDGFDNFTHQNPEYSPNEPVYVYARVRNKGCESSIGTEIIRLYWSKAATASTWPEYWNGSITIPALMGDEIGEAIIGQLGEGEETILEFEWYPPDPANYENINDEPWHFCLLSRIVAPSDPMIDELWSVPWNVGYNAIHNNNIAWKNISVVDELSNSPGVINGATIAVGNVSDQPQIFDLKFFMRNNFFIEIQDVKIILTLDTNSWDIWVAGGMICNNVSIFDERARQLLITDEIASLENLFYEPQKRSLINISFFNRNEPLNDNMKFDYHAVQCFHEEEEMLGGEKYIVSNIGEIAFQEKRDFEKILKDSKLLIRPNPASDILMIDYFIEKPNYPSLIIYSIKGEVVKNVELLNEIGNMYIDISDLKSGSYIISLFNNNSRIVNQKIVIE